MRRPSKHLQNPFAISVPADRQTASPRRRPHSSALLLAFDTLFALVRANVTAAVGREPQDPAPESRQAHGGTEAGSDQASCVPACLRETVGERMGETVRQHTTPDPDSRCGTVIGQSVNSLQTVTVNLPLPSFGRAKGWGKTVRYSRVIWTAGVKDKF